MKKLFVALLFALASSLAFGSSNSSPGLYYGQVPTAGQWNSYFATKLDYIPGTVNTIPYWDGSGNLLSAAVSGDCTSVANVFSCSVTDALNAVYSTYAVNATKATTVSVSGDAAYYLLGVASSSNSNQIFNLNSQFYLNPTTGQIVAPNQVSTISSVAPYYVSNVTTGTAPFVVSSTTPVSNLDLSYAATGSGAVATTTKTVLAQQPVFVTQYGAKCDGVTSDTAAFNFALAASKYVNAPQGTVCIVKNLNLSANQTLDLHGAVLEPDSGASYLVKVSDFGSQLINGQFADPSYVTMTSTTLASGAASGSNSLTLTSGTGFVIGNLTDILLDSGRHFISKITNVIGNTVTIEDTVPYSPTAIASVTGTGVGCVDGDVLVSSNGIGTPTVVSVTVSGGNVTAGTILTPGIFSTSPTNPVTFNNGKGAHCTTAPTLNLTMAGASSSNVIITAQGLLTIDRAQYSRVDNLRITNAPVAIQIKDTGTGTPPAYYTANNTISNIFSDSTVIAGIFLDVDSSNFNFRNITMYGVYPYSSGWGIYIDGQTPGVIAYGGHNFQGINLLQWETGLWNRGGALTQYNEFVSDTNKYEAAVFQNADTQNLGGAFWAAYTGSGGSKGSGLVLISSSINNIASDLLTSNNAVDLWVDSTSTLQLNDLAWGTSRIFLGGGNYNSNFNNSLGGAPGSDSLSVVPGVSGGDYVFVQGYGVGSGGAIGVKTAGSTSSYFYLNAPGTASCIVMQPHAGTTVTQTCAASGGSYSVTGSITSTGHISASTGNTPTISSGACGTGSNGTIAGTDQNGKITIGASATTACAITFGSSTWPSSPTSCVFSPATSASAAVTVLPYISALSTSGFTLSGSVLASTSWYYHCQ